MKRERQGDGDIADCGLRVADWIIDSVIVDSAIVDSAIVDSAIVDSEIVDWGLATIAAKTVIPIPTSRRVIITQIMRFLASRPVQNLIASAASFSKNAHFAADPHGPVFASAQAMTPDELKHRTKTFAVEIIKFTRTLPTDDIATAHIARQLVRSGSAVGANYRASCRAKSSADFISKMTTVEEEGDETLYWLELLVETDSVTLQRIGTLMSEADQLIRIIVASIKTSRGRKR